jgi:hypothetical protein
MIRSIGVTHSQSLFKIESRGTDDVSSGRAAHGVPSELDAWHAGTAGNVLSFPNPQLKGNKERIENSNSIVDYVAVACLIRWKTCSEHSRGALAFLDARCD